MDSFSGMIRLFLPAVCLGFAITIPMSGCKNNSSETSSATSKKDSIDKFADNIRRTPFQEPEEERKMFKLPPGFEITLFASEPDISKPINMEFDSKGRLWVTNTIEYPMPAKGRHGKDRIMILEDTNNDGKADKFTPFIDTLNIPIGMTPVHNGAIAYSIPNIYRFTDTDGDDKADKVKKLIGPFQYEDTHGMVNNLIRGFDGWIYACHGYANNSTVAGSDGDSITMQSGNTFRFREDGSRAEHTTFGRVNPFGYSYDEWGYLYSLDCHTKPIYQLINGAQYPAQGVSEPSIGWAPMMMTYEFGSTANSGMVYYTGTQWPDAYKNNFYSGNVVTCKINRNTMRLDGSSPTSHREEDFLVSDDPWFRPVDLKVGPDGSMYVADFYNRIIGHYEVPKDHPGRDRTSGRIWKITYKGNDKNYKPRDWSKASLNELINALNYPQLNIRMMIANLIVDNYDKQAAKPVMQMMDSTKDSKSFIQGLWILYRIHELSEPLLNKALQHTDPLVQVHALRALSETKTISESQKKIALSALQSSNPQVRRVAVEVLAAFPEFDYIRPLIGIIKNTDTLDTHLIYTAVLGIRSHLRHPSILQQVVSANWSPEEIKIIQPILPEISSKTSALLADKFLTEQTPKKRALEYQVEFISRYVNPQQLTGLVDLARKQSSIDTSEEYKLYKAISSGVAQKGDAETGNLKEWGQELQKRGLAPIRMAPVTPLADINLEEREKLIKDRIASYNPNAVTVEQGKQVFVRNCTPCHHIGTEPGGNIGPQLSGIGSWGQRAITEKVLNPNGSISTAYRMYNISLKDGSKMAGLFRRDEGKVIVFANYTGQEFIIPKAQIKSQEQVKYTLMPDQFRNIIPKQEFDALVKYLLSIKENQ